MARWHRRELFPGPLREFIEDEWPPVPYECLGHYACRGAGSETGCVPRAGELCGGRHYDMLAARATGAMLAAAMRADAFTRYCQARLSWLGEDHPDYPAELTGGWQAEDEIRYAPLRDGRAGGAA